MNYSDIKWSSLSTQIVFLTACGALFISAKSRRRSTKKIFHHLLTKAEIHLSGPKYILARNTHLDSVSLNLRTSRKPIVLVGDCRSGKTKFISHHIMYDYCSLWSRPFHFPRGLYLDGSQRSSNMTKWLSSQLPATNLHLPWATLSDWISDQYDGQKIRRTLHQIFKERLPSLLKPQPVTIVIDDAEELLRRHRAEFLLNFNDLVRDCCDTDLLRIVFVVNSFAAVDSLQLMNCGNSVEVIRCPNVSREAVAQHYGEEFALIFEKCESNIGIALDMKDFPKEDPALCAARLKVLYEQSHCLMKPISYDEYQQAFHHKKRVTQ